MICYRRAASEIMICTVGKRAGKKQSKSKTTTTTSQKLSKAYKHMHDDEATSGSADEKEGGKPVG
jgi:hypothetical protein